MRKRRNGKKLNESGRGNSIVSEIASMTNAVEVEEAHATAAPCAGILGHHQEGAATTSIDSLVVLTPTCRAAETAGLQDAAGHQRLVVHHPVHAHRRRGAGVAVHLLPPPRAHRRREDAWFLGRMIEGHTGAVTDADLAPQITDDAHQLLEAAVDDITPTTASHHPQSEQNAKHHPALALRLKARQAMRKFHARTPALIRHCRAVKIGLLSGKTI